MQGRTPPGQDGKRQKTEFVVIFKVTHYYKEKVKAYERREAMLEIQKADPNKYRDPDPETEVSKLEVLGAIKTRDTYRR